MLVTLQVAARTIREVYHGVFKIVDYQAVTAALPADYTIDGEHWGCRLDVYQVRTGGRVPGNLLAGASVSVVIRPCSCDRDSERVRLTNARGSVWQLLQI